MRQLTNSVGAVTDSYEYDAFGNEFTVSGSTPNEMMYRGEQYDSDLGLYYLRARYYNPLTGRFLSRDPEEGQPQIPATLHKYLYSGGDPVNWIDPTGHEDFIETGEIDEKESATTEVEGEDTECIVDDFLALEAYWLSLVGHAPVQSSPLGIWNTYGDDGVISGWTLYDEYGNRIYQYEIAPGTRSVTV